MYCKEPLVLRIDLYRTPDEDLHVTNKSRGQTWVLTDGDLCGSSSYSSKELLTTHLPTPPQCSAPSPVAKAGAVWWVAVLVIQGTQGASCARQWGKGLAAEVCGGFAVVRQGVLWMDGWMGGGIEGACGGYRWRAVCKGNQCG